MAVDKMTITLSLIASTPEQLSALTVQRQLLWGMKIYFKDFSQTKDGKFICWYEVPHSIYTEKVLNGKG